VSPPNIAETPFLPEVTQKLHVLNEDITDF